MRDSVLIGLCTCPDEACATAIAENLVKEGLAACVNRLSGVRSTYIWDGRLQDDAEILLIIKTTEARWPALSERLTALHPYEVPELLVWPVERGNEPYLDWVRTAVMRKGEE